MTNATEIPSVNPDDLCTVWEVFPHLQEQKAGGLSLTDVALSLTPGANIHTVIAHCAVLKSAIERGTMKPDAIDFTEAAKAIPLPVR